MGYLHIENLYRPKAQRILDFKELWALEKIHGTSAHIAIKEKQLRLFPGGENMEKFEAVFDQSLPTITEKLIEIFGDAPVTVFGEAYGGKCQGMSKTYGPTLSFVAFDVRVGETWLDVPNGADVCEKIGVPFVFYERVKSDLAALDAARDRPSEQAKRNGIDEPKITEGVVLRPPFEVTCSDGSRLIAKHKRAEFRERKTIPDVDPAKREFLSIAEKIADEWVTEMRLTHVLDKLGNPSDFQSISAVAAAMVEDVTREAEGEIVDDKTARKAIGAKAVKLYKARITQVKV